jgi:DNA-binding CsgD family transcriptional regulator
MPRVPGYKRTRLPYYVLPSSPEQSWWVRLTRAHIDAVAADRFPAQYHSAFLRELAKDAGELSDVALTLPESASPELRAAMGQPNGVDLVIGWVRDDGEFEAGLAGLTEQESAAWGMFLRGLGEREIASLMDGKRRKTKQFGVSVETVYKHLQHGRAKLEALFVMAA